MDQKDFKAMVLAGIIPPNTPAAELHILKKICESKGLDPMSREIYLLAYNSGGRERYAAIVGIDGTRKLAAQTGAYAGLDEIKFDLKADGTYKTAAELILSKTPPTTATATAYRIVNGIRVGFTHTAVYKEFAKNSPLWRSMPLQMIQKIAESFAIKKGFGDALSGLHVEEEMGAFEGATISANEEISPEDLAEIRAAVENCDTVDALANLYRENPHWADSKTIIQIMGDRKKALKNG